MLLNGARGLSEPQASCPECRFAFKHFFSPLEVPGFWNGARNIPLHSQNTILQILRSIPDTLPKPLSELNSCPVYNVLNFEHLNHLYILFYCIKMLIVKETCSLSKFKKEGTYYGTRN